MLRAVPSRLRPHPHSAPVPATPASARTAEVTHHTPRRPRSARDHDVNKKVNRKQQKPFTSSPRVSLDASFEDEVVKRLV